KLASGLEGKGRMEEPEAIVQWLEQFFKKKSRFNGKQVLITAGPTFENIDPVRFIGNYSSGKMGVALANQLAEEGASVTLILGPVSQEVKSRIRSATGHHGAITVHEVISAREMWDQANKCFADADIGIMSAAVSDFRPAHPAGEKIRRTGEILHLDLLPNPDIAFELGQTKRPGQILVGFALETGEGVKEALEKKKRKNIDLIVLNTLKHEGAGFGTDTNRITLIGKDNNPREFELKSKNEVARDIADAINELYN
ncbi:MAG: bifunctional phosphopantothenoylcysteine decarboxylase/phosphopantothenate--cysteine ligase CoaBC, partial [Bacteroidales bacterium]|nr:bifunctional phosphopantothenoylcysteine decarboxylase/phosphopantothenate--cysteine ligase CoaBC [Bacteroidales bacterium]